MMEIHFFRKRRTARLIRLRLGEKELFAGTINDSIVVQDSPEKEKIDDRSLSECHFSVPAARGRMARKSTILYGILPSWNTLAFPLAWPLAQPEIVTSLDGSYRSFVKYSEFERQGQGCIVVVSPKIQ
jgi:hypothetical protein